MANPIRVVVTGDIASLEAALGTASGSLVKFGSTADAVFGEYSTAALRAQVASDKLAVSLAKVPAGSTAAAAAVARYRGELDQLQAKQTAAAQAVGSSLTRGVTAPTLIAGLAAVKMGIDYQNTMQQIVGLSGVAQDKVNALSKEVLKLAPAVGRSPQELAKALYFITSSGIPASEAMNVLRVSAQAAAAGLGQTETVADAVTSAMNAYGAKALSAQQATDVLVATVREGKGEADQFAGVIGNVAALASQLHVRFNDVGAALAAMTRLGTDAETSATQLQRVFTSLLKTSPSAEKAFESVGLSAAGLRQELASQGLLATLDTIREAFGANTTAMAKAFADARALRGVLALVGNQAAATTQVFQGMSNTTGSLGSAFNAVSNDSAQRLNQDLARLQSDMVKLGTALAPLAANAADVAAKIADGFDALPGPVKADLGAIIGLLAVGGPLILGILGVTKAVRALGTMFTTSGAEARAAMTATAATSTATAATIEANDAAIAAANQRAAASGAGAGAAGGAGGLGGFFLPLLTIPIGQALANHFDAKGPAGGHFSTIQQVIEAAQSGGAKGALATGLLNKVIGAARNGDPNAQALLGSVNPAANPNALGPVPTSATTNGISGLPNAVGGGPRGSATLTQAQQLQLALALHPNDPTLLAQKRSQDRSTLAWLDRRFTAGKITAAEYVSQASPLRSDIAAITAQLVEATKKAAAASLAVNVPGLVSGSGSTLQRLFPGFRTRPSVPGGRIGGTGQGWLAANYQIPIDLQLAQARDEALGNKQGLIDDAKHVKAAAELAIKSDHLSKQAMIDAWNIITQANETIGGDTGTGGYSQTSAYKLVQGLAFKSNLDKRLAESRIAQALQHAGRVPTGLAAQGIGIPGTTIEVHTHTHLDGREIAHEVVPQLIQGGGPGGTRTGRLPGVRRGLA